MNRLKQLVVSNTTLQDSLQDCVRQIETSDSREFNKARRLLVNMLPRIKQSGIQVEEFIRTINEEYAIRKVPAVNVEMDTYRHSEGAYPLTLWRQAPPPQTVTSNSGDTLAANTDAEEDYVYVTAESSS